ncbi:LOW QUALITY PROTEIN: hypothetical protein TMLG_00867, partial [Mycobacterium tuberculosis SUMu012]
GAGGDRAGALVGRDGGPGGNGALAASYTATAATAPPA